MKELEGRVALVTGASRGIGTAVAQRLAAEGAGVAVTARTMDSHPTLPGTLRETVETIEGKGGKAIAIAADLSNPEVRAGIIEETTQKLGPIDILVNNAAACFHMPLEKYSVNRFRVAFEVNVRAPFEFAQILVPQMRERGGGWIVNIGSETSTLPQPPFTEWDRTGGSLIYGMTKAALDRFTCGLAAELLDAGIAVNLVAPVAAVITPGLEALGINTENVVVEPVEVMAEAVLALSVVDPRQLTGRLARSTPLLEELGRPVRTLDGRSPLTK
jgi:NAD(P)-dependent dehydrogenase (short-subunit alcohol dehydrogenase family)